MRKDAVTVERGNVSDGLGEKGEKGRDLAGQRKVKVKKGEQVLRRCRLSRR